MVRTLSSVAICVENRALDYEYPALIAELKARRAATPKHSTFNFHCRSGVGPQVNANRIVNHLYARQRWGPFLDEGVELVQIDRFHQVVLETYLAAFSDILFHPETSEGNSERRF